MRFGSSFVVCLVLGLCLEACGGSKPPAESAGTPPTAEPAPAPKVSEEPAEAPPAEAPKEEPRARKPAKDFLLGSGWDFVLSFRDSDLKDKADAQCEKKSKGDDEAKAKCMTKAAAEVANDRLKLTTDDKGGTWLVYMGKQNGREIVYTKLQYKLDKDEPDKLVLTPVGKDKGKQPMRKLPSEIVLEMPDEYAVVFEHPERGKLVFSVKVSGDSEPKPVEEGKPEKK
jgi:hypothetical protein